MDGYLNQLILNNNLGDTCLFIYLWSCLVNKQIINEGEVNGLEELESFK